MSGVTGHSANVGRQSTGQKVARDLLRLQRLQQSLTRAEGERKDSLEREIAEIVAGFGGPNVAKAMIDALAKDAENASAAEAQREPDAPQA